MTSNDPKNSYIEELLDTISADSVSLIDFDRLKEWLQTAKGKLDTADICSDELRLLREDYLNRIAGMVKAITAVERSYHDTQSALDYLENLKTVGAAELIEQYRKTSSRFRSAFPTTFGLPLMSATEQNGIKNPEIYK